MEPNLKRARKPLQEKPQQKLVDLLPLDQALEKPQNAAQNAPLPERVHLSEQQHLHVKKQPAKLANNLTIIGYHL